MDNDNKHLSFHGSFLESAGHKTLGNFAESLKLAEFKTGLVVNSILSLLVALLVIFLGK
jgi:hypothetical protein